MLLSSPSGNVDVLIEPLGGGRISSIRVGAHELIVAAQGDSSIADPVTWGCYPMVPFAGRIRRGVLDFEGQRYQLPPTLGPHAMHGYGFSSPWTQVDSSTIRFAFGEPWPFKGTATQHFALDDHRLQLTMTVVAEDRQPMGFGWHPWFRRDIGNGSLAELLFDATSMYERDPDGIPTGQLIDPPPGPWDDCFIGVRPDPVIRWGSFDVRLSSSADHWTVYDMPDHALCVEPQTGPPNEANTNPRILERGDSMTADFTLEW